jgi:hypothetical protein
MNVRLSRPGKTEPAHAELAADTEPDATELDATEPDTTGTDDTPGTHGTLFTGPPGDAMEGPLLPDAPQLRGNWQQVQASFVDDPRSAVAEAAALVDHAAQALAGALQQRQRRLRESWDSAPGETADAKSPDTERLRIAMRRYRALFNRICQP